MKLSSLSPLLAAASCLYACAADTRTDPGSPATQMANDPSAPMTDSADICSQEGQICSPDGLPFVKAAVAVSDVCVGDVGSCPRAASPPADATTATLTQPEAGKVCLSGNVSANGWAQILFVFSVPNLAQDAIVETFDAASRGITQVAFTVGSPPRTGVSVNGAITTSLSCPEDYIDCFTYGFSLMTDADSSSILNITAPGPVVAPFSHFKQTRPAPVSQNFDTTALEHLTFGVAAGPYDFCISDFRFLDDAGNAVNP